MKKVFLVMLMALITVSLLVGCKDPNEDSASVEGYIIYDCDADNNDENGGAGPDNLMSSACGWRYIQVAPADATVGDVKTFQMGYYNTTGGTGDQFNTDDGIGKGNNNTDKILATLSNRTKEYYSSSGVMDANYCAAKVASNYTVNGNDGWFLPSLAELKLMWAKRAKLGMNAETYLSSTENGYDVKVVSASTTTGDSVNRGYKGSVRAVRYISEKSGVDLTQSL